MHTRSGVCEVKRWTIGQLLDAVSKKPQGDARILIPRYQRRITWNRKKQARLIDSLKAGFPVGSLLLSKEGAEGKLTVYGLVDGLQRTTAIMEYDKNATSFYEDDEKLHGAATGIEAVMEQERSRALDIALEDNTSEMMVEWVRSKRGFSAGEGWDKSELARSILEGLREPLQMTDDEVAQLRLRLLDGPVGKTLGRLLDEIKEEANINGIELPVVIYSGDPANLPEIFERLNSEGTTLSKYQIFAATWVNERDQISSTRIVDAIWHKYAALEEQGLTLDTADESGQQEIYLLNYSLFEYLFGMGKVLADDYPGLFSSTDPDEAEPAGFNLYTLCAGRRIAQMAELRDVFTEMDREKRDRFEERLMDSAAFVEMQLRPVTYLREADKVRTPLHHTQMQAVSMIAYIFKTKYDENLEERDDWPEHERALQKHLRMRYLYDVLRNEWRGSGDTQAFTRLSTSVYEDPIPRSQWENALSEWLADQLNEQHVRRYVPAACDKVLFLKYLFAHTLTAFEHGQNNYHVEHLAPVKLLVNASARWEGNGWPINCVANLALMEERANTEKQDKTIIQFFEHKVAQGELSEDQKERMTEEACHKALCPQGLLQPVREDMMEEEYRGFLKKRFENLRERFFDLYEDAMV